MNTGQGCRPASGKTGYTQSYCRTYAEEREGPDLISNLYICANPWRGCRKDEIATGCYAKGKTSQRLENCSATVVTFLLNDYYAARLSRRRYYPATGLLENCMQRSIA
jgi:hypothetical protein